MIDIKQRVISALDIRNLWKDNEEGYEEETQELGENGQFVVTQLDKNKKQLGLISSIFLISNRMLGTGVFATSSEIYTLCGSVGLSLIMWVVGAIISLSGLYVYMEYGTAIPKNGGEKNYLEFLFKKPKFLITCMYAAYVFFLGWAAGNSINTAVMFLTAGDAKITEWNQRGIGVAVIFFAFAVNAVNVKLGLYLQNVLGIIKFGIIIFIAVSGWVALGGGTNHGHHTNYLNHAFDGTENATAYGIVNALYNVIWSFIGYSNVNYALGEVKNPVRTLKIAGPVSLITIAILYIFVNISYFAVVPKERLVSSKLVLAADYFDIIFGGRGKEVAAAFVGLSALGNVLSVIFSQGRIIQQLGREGVLPFPSLFASSKPLNTPMVGLFQHFIVCLVTIIAPPPGDAYNFILNLISYPMNIINFIISTGLIWIHWQAKKGKLEWNPPIKAGVWIAVFFSLSNAYLIVAPYVPPTNGQSVYNSLPYWIHCVVAWAIFAFGACYWVVFCKVIPKLGHYSLDVKEELNEDGFWRTKFVKVYDEKPFSDEEDLNTTNTEQVYETIDDKSKDPLGTTTQFHLVRAPSPNDL